MSNRKLPRSAVAELKYERIGNFFKALAGSDAAKAWCVKHGMATVWLSLSLKGPPPRESTSAGGFPTLVDFDASIIAIRETVGAFRAGAQVTMTTSDSDGATAPCRRCRRKFCERGPVYTVVAIPGRSRRNGAKEVGSARCRIEASCSRMRRRGAWRVFDITKSATPLPRPKMIADLMATYTRRIAEFVGWARCSPARAVP